MYIDKYTKLKTMKTARNIIMIITCCALLVLSQTSCLVRKDYGKHKGWFKNSNNPHHPNSTNPGHNKGKGKPGK